MRFGGASTTAQLKEVQQLTVINALTSSPGNRDVRVHDLCLLPGGSAIFEGSRAIVPIQEDNLAVGRCIRNGKTDVFKTDFYLYPGEDYYDKGVCYTNYNGALKTC